MTYTKEFIAKKVSMDNRWLEHAILALYKKQTETEKALENAIIYNKVGFSAAHARTLSYDAKWLLSGRSLSGYHVEKARKYVLHYTRQLADIANEKE